MENRKIKDSKKFHDLYNRWRRLDVLVTFLALYGLVIGMIKYELDVRNFPHSYFDGIASFTEEQIHEIDL